MPPLNYTTKIDPRKTIGEIQNILADMGAQRVYIKYDNKLPIAVTFQVEVKGHFVGFRLPSRWQGVYKLLCTDAKVPRPLKTEEQARRVAWRIIKDWVEAQTAIIEAGAAELAEVFLPYAVRPETGKTFYEEFSGGYLLAAANSDQGEIVEG